MKKQNWLAVALMVSVLLSSFAVYAQVKRQYRPGSVWEISMVHVKYGMDEAYMNHLTTVWKGLQEAAKKEKLILSYKVLRTENHTPGDWNLLLMVEYKDLASLEGAEQKADALAQRMVGDDQTQQKGMKDRLEVREILGTRVAREVVLEPRP